MEEIPEPQDETPTPDFSDIKVVFSEEDKESANSEHAFDEEF